MGKNQDLLTLDLHGKKVDEVFDALERFLRAAEEEGVSRVRILHGKGTGKVKAEVLRYLKLANYPSQAEKSPSGIVNDGSLLVFLN